MHEGQVCQSSLHNWVLTCLALLQARSLTFHKESQPTEGWEGWILIYDIKWALQSLAHSNKAASKNVMVLLNLLTGAQHPWVELAAPGASVLLQKRTHLFLPLRSCIPSSKHPAPNPHGLDHQYDRSSFFLSPSFTQGFVQGFVEGWLTHCLFVEGRQIN